MGISRPRRGDLGREGLATNLVAGRARCRLDTVARPHRNLTGFRTVRTEPDDHTAASSSPTRELGQETAQQGRRSGDVDQHRRAGPIGIAGQDGVDDCVVLIIGVSDIALQQWNSIQ